jgi:hypothetical protein
VSRGFISTVVGLGMTLFAWFSPWEWPAWPAFGVISIAFGSNSAFADLPMTTRAAVVVGLIIFNSACWAAVAWVVITAIIRLRHPHAHGRLNEEC